MRASIRELLRNPRLRFSPIQRADLLLGGFDARLVDTLAAIGQRHTIVITALRADHRPGSNHEAGRAFDIGAVDGDICRGATTGPCVQLVRELAHVDGPARSTELIYLLRPRRTRRPARLRSVRSLRPHPCWLGRLNPALRSSHGLRSP